MLLLASINYQLNLGYILTFLLAGSGIVSMHVTHSARCAASRCICDRRSPVLAGTPVRARPRASRAPGKERFGIGLRVLDA